MRKTILNPPEFSLDQVDRLTNGYKYKLLSLEPQVVALGKVAGERGWLKRKEFLLIARWKSPRPTPIYQRNTEEDVINVTKRAFSATQDLERILLLTELKGVRVRTATAILHLCFPDHFPLMDIWAISAMGVSRNECEKWDELDWLRVWPEYADRCRDYARKFGRDLRSIDRALWTHGKEQASEPAGAKQVS
jgi:hypothetical protein